MAGVHAPLPGRGIVRADDPVGATAGAVFPPATVIRPSGPKCRWKRLIIDDSQVLQKTVEFFRKRGWRALIVREDTLR